MGAGEVVHVIHFGISCMFSSWPRATDFIKTINFKHDNYNEYIYRIQHTTERWILCNVKTMVHIMTNDSTLTLLNTHVVISSMANAFSY